MRYTKKESNKPEGGSRDPCGISEGRVQEDEEEKETKARREN